MPRVSVVIPCYNHGRYLDEAVDSVLRQSFEDFEIVIVDDGSTDPATKDLLATYHRPKTRVFIESHAGLSATRNRAIRAATGDYILPLDADDRIGETYLEQAVRKLDEDPRLGIVYCEAELFGTRSGRWLPRSFAWPEMLWQNMIFCTAMFRRSDWAAAGGFRTALVHGMEDWDFWLALLERGAGVYRIPERLFFYRVSQESMARALVADSSRYAHERRIVMLAHLKVYAAHVEEVFDQRRRYSGFEDLAARIALRSLAMPQSLSRLSKRWMAAAGLLAWAALAPAAGGRPAPRRLFRPTRRLLQRVLQAAARRSLAERVKLLTQPNPEANDDPDSRTPE